MSDRPAREKMIDSIERYLAEGMNSEDFDAEIGLQSDDLAVEVVCDRLWPTYCDIQYQTVHKCEQHWDIYRRWMVFLRTDYQLEELNLIPAWNYPWILRGAFAAVATLPVILFWGQGVAYLSSCSFIVLVFLLVAGYAARRHEELRRRHESKWRPRKEWEPFLSEADWRAHESIADTMSIPPTPPPGEEEPEETKRFISWLWLFPFLFCWLSPAWIPLLVLWPGKWQVYYTLQLRTSESDGAISSTDSL